MPTKHCRACQQFHPGCLCNTCKRDSLYKAPACCTEKECPVRSCPEYERECKEEDENEENYRGRF